MKKTILAIAFVASTFGALNAQVSGKAIGLRLGGGFGYGAEVSYQHPLSSSNRLEFDLGANRDGFGLNGIYHWVKDLSDLGEGFNWYYGLGAGIGSYDFSGSNSNNKNVFRFGILGQIGLEYKFEIPLTISIDYRPGVYLIDGFNSSMDGICISGRYRF